MRISSRAPDDSQERALFDFFSAFLSVFLCGELRHDMNGEEDVTRRCFMFDEEKRELGLFLLNENGSKYVLQPDAAGNRAPAIEIITDADFAVKLKDDAPRRVKAKWQEAHR